MPLYSLSIFFLCVFWFGGTIFLFSRLIDCFFAISCLPVTTSVSCLWVFLSFSLFILFLLLLEGYSLLFINLILFLFLSDFPLSFSNAHVTAEFNDFTPLHPSVSFAVYASHLSCLIYSGFWPFSYTLHMFSYVLSCGVSCSIGKSLPHNCTSPHIAEVLCSLYKASNCFCRTF